MNTIARACCFFGLAGILVGSAATLYWWGWPYVIGEDNLVESMTAILFVAAAVVGFRRFARLAWSRSRVLLLILAAGSLVCFLEEISYGDNWFHYRKLPTLDGARLDGAHDVVSVWVHRNPVGSTIGRVGVALLAGLAVVGAWQCRRRGSVGYLMLFISFLGIAQIIDLHLVRPAYYRELETLGEMLSALALTFAVWAVEDPVAAGVRAATDDEPSRSLAA